MRVYYTGFPCARKEEKIVKQLLERHKFLNFYFTQSTVQRKIIIMKKFCLLQCKMIMKKNYIIKIISFFTFFCTKFNLSFASVVEKKNIDRLSFFLHPFYLGIMSTFCFCRISYIC